MPRYIVEKQIGDDEQWYKESEWTDPVKMSLAMWELGLMRPEYSAIRIRESKEMDKVQFYSYAPSVDFLMNKYGVSKSVALIALRHNNFSIVHAGVSLNEPSCVQQYEREAHECDLD